MIKKIVVLIAVLFLITGCSVDYNLKIGNNAIDEEIVVNNVTFEFQDYSIYYDVDSFSETNNKIEGVEYYTKNKLNNSVIFNHSFDWQNYFRSRASRTCLKSVSLSSSSNSLILSTSSGFSCFKQFTNMSSINVNITIDTEYYDIVNSNADSNNGNIYTWTIDNNNYNDKYIQLLFNRKHVANNLVPKKENELSKYQDDFWLIMGVAFLSMIIIIVVAINLNKSKR